MTEETKVFTAEELIEQKKLHNLTTIMFAQLEEDLVEAENERMVSDVQELTNQNMIKGGSEHGFYFENELFAVGSSYNIGEISPIHEDLYSLAYNLKENRNELRQDVTYIGNFLSVIDSITDNCTVFIANLPAELSKFISSIRTLEAHANIHEQEDWREIYKFDRSEPEFANFYLHYDRVEPRLKRYLFRRVTQ